MLHQAPRECYCDVACQQCDELGTACPEHVGVYCSGHCDPRPDHDGRWLHASCLGGHVSADGSELRIPYDRNNSEDGLTIPLRSNTQDEHPFYCIECWDSEHKSLPENECVPFAALTGDTGLVEEKARRLGYNVEAPPDGKPVPQRLGRRLDQYVASLRANVADDALVDSILASSPRPYPTTKPMDPEMRRNSAIHGRRFELMQLNFIVPQCDCCGMIRPYQNDSWYPETKLGNFHRAHLHKKFQAVKECRCDGVCKGRQFYNMNSPKHRDFFAASHDGVALDSFAGVTDALLCDFCFKDVVSHNGVVQLDQCRKFSRRNGFGPIPRPAANTMAHQLVTILDAASAAEEAAVRQITALVSIVRLSHGNIGAKGTTSCVWQKSTLHPILPNLPRECKVINITRRQQQGSTSVSLSSYKYKRFTIQRILELFDATGHEAFQSYTYEPSRLSAWEVEGDLLGVCLQLPDPDDERTRPSGDASGDGNDGRVADEGDDGPAPLQNAEEPTETWTGTTLRENPESNDPVAEANQALRQFEATAQFLNQQRHEQQPGGQQQGGGTTHQIHSHSFVQ